MDAPPSTPVPSPQSASAPRRSRGPLTLHNGGEGGMEIRHPRSLDDRKIIGLDLKQRHTVTLDLSRLPDAEARYFLEFVYGVVFALDASAVKVNEGIYILAPYGVEVRNDVEDAGEDDALAVAHAAQRRGDDGEMFWQAR